MKPSDVDQFVGKQVLVDAETVTRQTRAAFREISMDRLQRIVVSLQV